jgi:hypothetical protein
VTCALGLTLMACAPTMKIEPPAAALGPLFCDVAAIIPNPTCAKEATRAKIDANNRLVKDCPPESRARAGVP